MEIDDLPDTSTGVIITETFPGTYCARFTNFSPEAAVNARQAEFYLKTLQEAIARDPQRKINVINDTRLISDRVRILSKEARAFYLTAYRLPQIERVAMVGFGPWLKNFIYILAQFANRSAQTRFFATPEEAEAWLKK